jgi:IS1 family transposase
MSEPGCGKCAFRARYDKNPKSLLGRLWRWHINFCPGWRAYMKSLPEEEKKTLTEKYKFPPTKFA